MNTALRRMVVQKYNNRPPFDRKKKEALNIPYRKSFNHVEQSFKSIMDHLDSLQSDCDLDLIIDSEDKPEEKKSETPKKNIAPKIIATFHKITPKRVPLQKNTAKRFPVVGKNLKKSSNKPENNEDFPVETLYRNTHLEFGKNLPNHKMMKHLLKNFKSSNQSLCANGRINKATSTTSIIWPVPVNVCENTKVSPRDAHIQRAISNLNSNGKKRQPPMSKFKTRQSKSRKEIFLTDLNVKEQNVERNSKNSKSFIRSKSAFGKSTTTVKDVKDNRLKKPQSFVKSQVVKFQKISDKPSKKQPNARPNKPKTKKGRNDYLGMMNSVKATYPVLEPQIENSNSEHCGWSSGTEKEQTPFEEQQLMEDIKFPRETKDAVEQMIQSSRKYLRTPLAKYLKNFEPLSIQPAISINHEQESKEVYSTGDDSNSRSGKAVRKRNKRRMPQKSKGFK